MSRIPAIFISYRRDDKAHAERLWDQMAHRFGEENVFFDRNRGRSLEPGKAFPEGIAAGVLGAEILLLLIGPEWGNEANLLRLTEDEDWVRREIKLALNRRKNGERIEIFPLLAGNAHMPEKHSLPPELQDLAIIQAHSLREGTEDYREDILALTDTINIRSPGLRARQQNAWLSSALCSPEQSMANFSQDIAVRYPTRQPIPRLGAHSALEEWWTSWQIHQQAFVLLGEEGDGKSWACAEWLASKLNDRDFPVPIVFAPALRLASASIPEMLAACLEQSQPTDGNNWPRRIAELSHAPQSDRPLFLLVVDACNERTQLDWRILFDSLRAPPWRVRIALLVLCRKPYWATLEIPDDELIATWTLPPFNDEELEQALAQRNSSRSRFDGEILHLMARPRYFDLAFRLHRQIETGGLTLERLIYEDWRDMTGRKRQQSCNPGEFHALIAELARQYEERRFTIPDFVLQAQGIAADTRALRQELLSLGILNERHSKLVLEPRYLTLGLGLVLANEVEDSTESDPETLNEVIAKRLGSCREADLQVRICGIALFHALNTQDYPEAGCLALLRAWIEGRNLDDIDLETIAAYLPLRPQTYLHMAEYIWGTADNRAAQDAFMVGFLRHRKLPAVNRALLPAFTNWLGIVYPWGYRAYFERDEKKLEEAREAVAKRLGQPAVPGTVQLFGVTLHVVANAGLLRLAQVALAVLSHERSNAASTALLTGLVARATMEGSHGEYAWVLRTSCPETRQALLKAARQLLATTQPTAYLAARSLLACLGGEEARALLAEIPTEFRFTNHHAELRNENPCSLIFGPWKKENHLDCLRQEGNSRILIASQLKALALDPEISIPPNFCSKFNEAGDGINLTQVGHSMGTTPDQHHLEVIEPALCAFAPRHYQTLMRRLAQNIVERTGLARRQLAWLLLDHAPVLGDDERTIILEAWRATLTTTDEDSRITELSLFPIVLLDRSPEEQSRFLMERGEKNGYWTQHAPSFRPLTTQQVPTILSALDTLPTDSKQARYSLLWYLSETLCVPDPEIRQYLLAHFGDFDSVDRAYSMEIFCNSNDAEAARQIIANGWTHRTGRNYAMENAHGSILLIEFGKALPFDELASRISPEWLGHAVTARGSLPGEMASYARLLNDIWQNLYDKTLTPETQKLGRYVVLKADPFDAKQVDSLSVRNTDANNLRFANYTWGGRAGTPQIDDLKTSLDPDAQFAQHQALAKQVTEQVNREYEEGNPWFAYTFRNGALTELLRLNDTPWPIWLAAVRENNCQAGKLLALCRGFYEKLCAALLAHAPADGLALYHILAAHPGVNITDALLTLPTLLLDVFAAPHSPETEQLLRDHIEHSHTDMALFECALLCQRGEKTNWLRQLTGELLASEYDDDRARALALLGYSDAAEDGDTLATWIRLSPDCWVRDVAEIALENHQRNRWARHWFERFLSHQDRTEAWAAFRLFLRCTDRRSWLWGDNEKLASADSWKQDAFTMNRGTIQSAIKENEKGRKEKFLGHSTKPDELWPWMKRYQ